MTTTDEPRQVDEAALEQFMGQMVGYMTGSMMCLAIWMGDELGLYRSLAGGAPRSADEVARAAGCHPRLVREWLDSQVAGGLIGYDSDSDRYHLSPEAELALANDESPAFVARAMNAVGAMYIDFEAINEAFRGDGALPWGDHHPCLFTGTEWFFRTGYRAELPRWLGLLEGIGARLERGGKVADIGCGHGASAAVMAGLYPDAEVYGFDFHAPSIETAKQRAQEAGVAENTVFGVADATGYEGVYDLICYFDCLHDMGDPVGILRYARDHIDAEGTVLLVEPFALPDRNVNLRENPMAALLYTASTVVCSPNSLSQDVGLALGAQAGADRLREVCAEAGFTRFRQVAETPMNLVLEARP